MVFCTAIWNGTEVFTYISMEDSYDLEKIVPVFVDHNGEMIMHDAKVADLTDIAPVVLGG